MIKGKHHFFIYPLFKAISLYLIKNNFNSVNIMNSFIDKGKSILVLANHISWWDGFWMMLLNIKLFKRNFNFMMLEEQLKKHWYFQYTGGYSIKKKSKDILKSLNYTIELLGNTKNLVLIFPQGSIQSMHNNYIKFESGINKIIRDCPNEIQIIFLVNIIDYFSNRKPNLFIYFQEYEKDNKNLNIEIEYNNFYTQVLNRQKTIQEL